MKNPALDDGLPRLLHGADYNPDQWLDRPEVLEEDFRLMKEAGCNVMSVGIFAWSALEPEEGRFRFDWLDRVMDRLAGAGLKVILATPSGGRPHWLSAKYQEVQRVTPDRRRRRPGGRHNHCFTSPLFREKAGIVNARLAARYKEHPALLMWHLSNEYGGECHCHLCQEAFRAWLRRRYGDSLDALNRAWWTSFWSHAYTDWHQIESPSPLGEMLLPGLNLDWKRFVTAQTADFMRAEMAPLREITPDVPVTSNFMGAYPDLDYRRLASELDLVSWDSYPCWHAPAGGGGGDWRLAADTGFIHSLMRSLKGGRPFLLMESTPSTSSWHPVQKLKRPGLHVLSSLLAVAHGADSVQYFQWRPGRGGCEKFHGSVAGHDGDPHGRVFREVAELGELLAKLGNLAGTRVESEAAVIFDWENRWALEGEAAPRHDGLKAYEETCRNHHAGLWAQGLPVDVIGMEDDFSAYRLLVAPMLYMVRAGVGESLEGFVSAGGTLVATYWSGRVDENDLCFTDGFPGPLSRLLGIRCEEIDCLYPGESNRVVFAAPNPLSLSGEYAAREFCALIRAETARVLAVYGDDFYRGRPALTVNAFGRGRAFFLASRNEERFLTDFYRRLAADLDLRRPLTAQLPEGVAAGSRTGGNGETLFLLNFSDRPRTLSLKGEDLRDLLDGRRAGSTLKLAPLSFRILSRPR